MRHSILLLLHVIIAISSYSQNVGIGTTTPSEKLDVNGNLNITGTIKTNGTTGSSGQVLMSTGAGLSWGSAMNYKKCVVIFSIGSGNWTVPAGVTEVMVELWGAGSGGTTNCGGTSGGYARTIQTVTPGYNVAYSVGLGSTYGTTTTLDGGNTQATFPLGYISASGGGGIGSAQSKGIPQGGTGSLANNFFYMPGNTGNYNSSTFGMKNSTTYVEILRYGSGGTPVGMLHATPLEGDVIRFENGLPASSLASHSSRLPGAGGAAGSGSGWSGGNGMIIFWFNN